MKYVVSSKLNSGQRKRISELFSLCTEAEPIRLTIPLPSAGELLTDERFFLLYDNGCLVSLIHLFFPDHIVGELIGFTHPAHRRQGYFRRLLSRALDEAEALGLEQVYLISDGRSDDALGALAALSLEPEYSEYMLQKPLSPRMEPVAPPESFSPAMAAPVSPPKSASLVMDKSAVTPENTFLTVKEITDPQITAALFAEIFQAETEQCEDYMAELVCSGDNSDERDSIDGVHSYCLLFNGSPVGQAQLTYVGRVAYLSGFGIVPALRRNGLGKYFLRQLEIRLASQEMTHLTLQVSSLNRPALALYHQDGFTDLEVLHYYPLFEAI